MEEGTFCNSLEISAGSISQSLRKRSDVSKDAIAPEKQGRAGHFPVVEGDQTYR